MAEVVFPGYPVADPKSPDIQSPYVHAAIESTVDAGRRLYEVLIEKPMGYILPHMVNQLASYFF